MSTTRIVMPDRAKHGEVITIKTLIQHVMETGFRRDDSGAAIPRNIIETVVVTYGATEIFRAKLYPGIAANPYFQFSTVATETGDLTFTWTDQGGLTTRETRRLTVA